METFTPSLDWGDELITSLLWVAKAWVIAAVCTLVIVAVLARYTTWGRQFWRITGDYFKGRQSIPDVGAVGCAAGIGDDRRAPRRVVQLSVQ